MHSQAHKLLARMSAFCSPLQQLGCYACGIIGHMPGVQVRLYAVNAFWRGLIVKGR